MTSDEHAHMQELEGLVKRYRSKIVEMKGMAMSDIKREMTLGEVVGVLPEGHRAKRELKELREAASRLSSPDLIEELTSAEYDLRDAGVSSPRTQSAYKKIQAIVARLSSPEGTRGLTGSAEPIGDAAVATGAESTAALTTPSSAPAATPCQGCGHAPHPSGRCNVALGLNSVGDDAMCRCLVEASPRVSAATPVPDTYPIPKDGWVCFHCGERFTTWGSARDHFGEHEGAEAGCLIDRVALEEGGKPERGRGLLMALRKAEAEVARLSAAERPAPTCATCRWWDGRDCPDAEQRGLCNVDTTDYLVLGAFKTRSNFGCTLHEPAPPGPVAQERRSKR